MEHFSLTDIKKKNRSDVFHYIYRHSGCSKQNIATALNISLPTVTQHLTALMDEQLIETCGQLRSSVGRKAIAYRVVGTAKLSMGIEILADTVYMVTIDLYGHKIVKEKIRLNFQPDTTYFEMLRDTVYAFLREYSIKEEQLLGIGLAIQGLASADGRTITYGEILDSTGISIEIFEKYFSVPCRFIHDAECAANSELWENSTLKDAIYLSLGRHLGGAIILDGKLQKGLTGKSGTFEHMTLVPKGRTCYCGKQGCAECYCAANAFLTNDMEPEDFFELKSQGNLQCNESWKEYLYYLSVLINNLHMVLENTIILGGYITPYFTEDDIAAIRQNIRKLSTFCDSTDFIRIGKCRNDAVSIGAALPFIQEFLQNLAALDDAY